MMKGKFRVIEGGLLMLWCPACDGGHTIRIPPWGFNGDYDKPTITGSLLSNGVDEKGDPLRCHCFVVDGIIDYLSDCSHKLAGQKVPLPDLPDWLKNE